MGLINNFTVFDRLKNYNSFLMKDPADISDDMLATIEAYQTMGKHPGRLPPDSITSIIKANRIGSYLMPISIPYLVPSAIFRRQISLSYREL